MFKEISKNETEDLLLQAGAYASDKPWEVSLGQYPDSYRLHRAFQCVFTSGDQDLASRLSERPLPEVPEGCRITVVLEMAPPFTLTQLRDIHAWAKEALDGRRLERFESVCLYDSPFVARVSVIYHDAVRRRSFSSRIGSQSRLLRDLDIRIARKLDGELDRNATSGAVVAPDADAMRDMLCGRHLLWTDVAGTTRSVSEIVKRFRPEMDRTRREYDVSGLLLFVEVDKDFTTMGEVDSLKRRLADQAGKGVEVALGVRLRDSFIKSVTCRATLVGGPRYVKGEVFEDFGRFEILLHESEDRHRGHVIVASYAEGEFALSRYDWGNFERNRRGETDDHHYFDSENTSKLVTVLRVSKPEALLRMIRRRFASRRPADADSCLLAFCRKEGIEYQSDYHY